MKNNSERKLKSKPCARCTAVFEPTGSNCRRCPPCRLFHQREQAARQHALHPGRKHGTGKGYDQRGEKNNAWKGGTSPKYYQAVCFKAWGTNCMGCPAPAVLAHHRDEDRSNNTPGNLTPLCKRCHQLIHRCAVNLPRDHQVYPARPCPVCKKPFMPTGARGRCPDCKAAQLREQVTFRPKTCETCESSFTPDSPRRSKCSRCRGVNTNGSTAGNVLGPEPAVGNSGGL